MKSSRSMRRRKMWDARSRSVSAPVAERNKRMEGNEQMDLTKFVNPNSRQDEPVQEQPKLSKEEYAALKKIEREELWARLDTLTTDVFKDAEDVYKRQIADCAGKM